MGLGEPPLEEEVGAEAQKVANEATRLRKGGGVEWRETGRRRQEPVNGLLIAPGRGNGPEKAG